MTTSRRTQFLADTINADHIPAEQLAYFRARLSSRIYDLVIKKYLAAEKAGRLNRAVLARRIGRKPEQITRWLRTPGNWTLNTFSDLMLAMGSEPGLSDSPLLNRPARNFQAFNWLEVLRTGRTTPEPADIAHILKPKDQVLDSELLSNIKPKSQLQSAQ